MAHIDHVILRVNDLEASVDFYVGVLGFQHEGQDGPFTVLRVDPSFVLQLAPYGTEGNEHYAYAMGAREFAEALARLEARGIPYGPRFDAVGSNTGPGVESGARGEGSTIYMFDPNRHLVEIRTYEAEMGH
jgi:catechol 2,3-dioxygenase-like lactoylglutathione lyase family enzyme